MKIKKITLTFSLIFMSVQHAAYASLESSGDVVQIVLPAAGAVLAGTQQDWVGLKQFTYSGLATLSTVQILKHTVHRKRPNGHPYSFPSGHTAAAFWGAGFLQMRYGWYVGAPAYALAGFVGYSRVATHNHFTSDVIAGMAIGLGFTYLFTSSYSTKLNVATYTDPSRKESGIVFTKEL